jgi:hypothetical protein
MTWHLAGQRGARAAVHWRFAFAAEARPQAGADHGECPSHSIPSKLQCHSRATAAGVGATVSRSRRRTLCASAVYFRGYHYASLGECQFDLARAEADDIVRPDSVADDLRWEAMPGKGGGCGVIRPALPNLNPTASRANLAMPWPIVIVGKPATSFLGLAGKRQTCAMQDGSQDPWRMRLVGPTDRAERISFGRMTQWQGMMPSI